MNEAATAGSEYEYADDCGVPFDVLVERYQKKVFNLLLRMIGDYDEAADLTQDVFLQAYRALPTFRGEAKIYTWLYRIAINRCKNRIKQISRDNSLVSSSLDDPVDADDTASRDVPDHSYVPDRQLERTELRAVVSSEISNLPPDFREVIVLRDLQGLSYREMADVVGISLEAVKSRLFRARQCLRERLQPYLQGTASAGPAEAARRRPAGGAR
jgi:RNA polymerase sigma-70 factor (ECF subfamily)